MIGVLGRTPIPRVQYLVVEVRACRWFVLYHLCVWSATAALLLTAPAVFQAAVTAMMLATVAIAAELVRARRLDDVTETLRFPAGAKRPHLLVSIAAAN